MNKILSVKVSLLFLLLFNGAMASGAQTTATLAPSIIWYDAEGTTFCKIAACTPGTEASFYSQPWGGKQVMSVITNELGTATINTVKAFKPAFVVNIGGNNRVTQMPKKTFTLSGISLGTFNGGVLLEWKGSAPGENAVRFEVLKRNDQGNYLSTALFTAAEGSSLSTFQFREAHDAMADSYKIQVSTTTGILYTTGIFGLNNGITLYPTLASSNITLSAVIKNNDQATYQLISSNGQIVASGILSNGANLISVAQLSAGAYLAVTHNGEHTSTQKFEKL